MSSFPVTTYIRKATNLSYSLVLFHERLRDDRDRHGEEDQISEPGDDNGKEIGTVRKVDDDHYDRCDNDEEYGDRNIDVY